MGNYVSELLKEVVTLAKSKGYKVFTYKTDKPITYIIIENQKGEIGACASCFGGIRYDTKHKSTIQNGAGYSMANGVNGINTIDQIDLCFAYKPGWASNSDIVVNYKGMDEYIKKNKVLTYYEL